MKIMYLTAEISPFSKAGGLGDVLGALPKAVEKLSNLCAIFTPLYSTIDCEKFNITEIPNSKIKLKFGQGEYIFTLKMAKLPDSDINVFFIESKKYFSSFQQIYPSDIALRYEQERYTVFTKAALEYAKLLNFKPDIVHLNDWHSAIGAAYLKTIYKHDSFYENCKVIFSIHNLAYQGVYYEDILDFAGLPKTLFVPDGVEKFELVNWVKGAINLSDFILTVSPKYAQEIQTEEFGCGLYDILQKRKDDLRGILNGLDYSVFNPETDKNLVKNYNYKTVENKKYSKQEICKIFNIKYSERPLICVISRIVEQKGFDLILRAEQQLEKLDADFVILGSGDKNYTDFLKKLNKDTKNIKANTNYSEELARKLYAGSDMLLMPSHFEPCGLSQIIAMKYGTIPLVRAVGGLENTVTGYPLNNSNGFKFWRYEPEDMLECINTALTVFKDKSTFKTLIKSAMEADFSWENSAKEYINIYKNCNQKSNIFSK